MPEGRPFRFGIAVNNAVSRERWVEQARKVEGLGYSTLLMWDHFGEQLAPLPALMAAAAATTTLRVGSYVLDNDYRHPVLLAKEAATLDVLSGGRLELGLGAGWMRAEYHQAGIAFDAPGVRIGRMHEAIQVLNGLFADRPCTFEGRYYRIAELDGLPKPLQQPRPPLLIGGAQQRLLSIAAREADIVAFTTRALPNGSNDPADLTAEAAARQLEWVRAAAGERFAELELQFHVRVVWVTDRRAQAIEQLSADLGISAEQVRRTPQVLVGSVDQMVEDLRARRERYGFSYIAVDQADLDRFAPVVARLAGT